MCARRRGCRGLLRRGCRLVVGPVLLDDENYVFDRGRIACARRNRDRLAPGPAAGTCSMAPARVLPAIQRPGGVG
jgi:hypothetical protein